MTKVVLDTPILVSAFLRPDPGGASIELLKLAMRGRFALFLSDGILEETARVLLRPGRMRDRYAYADEQVIEYCQDLGRLADVIETPPSVRVVRDPNDDMIIACALAAQAHYLVSRDKDLLVLGEHGGVAIVAPETFLRMFDEEN